MYIYKVYIQTIDVNTRADKKYSVLYNLANIVHVYILQIHCICMYIIDTMCLLQQYYICTLIAGKQINIEDVA